MQNRYRLGIDIGGTFTNLLLMDEKTGSITILKTPSTQWPVDVVPLRNKKNTGAV